MEKNLYKLLDLFAAIVLFSGCDGTSIDNPVGSNINSIEDYIAYNKKHVSAEDFNKIAVGYVWDEKDTRILNPDGRVSTEIFWRMISGGGPIIYDFGDETVTYYFEIDPFTGKLYQKTPMTYDETSQKLFINGKESFVILSAKEDAITAIDSTSYSSWGVCLYKALKRLSDEEMQNVKENYWINYNDVNRTMTKDDLLHKWVLRGYTDKDKKWYNFNTEAKRSDDTYSIKFNSDGTVEGKNKGTEFKGTFVYDMAKTPYTIKITCKTKDGDEWPTNLPSVSTFDIQHAAYLKLYLNSNEYYYFIRCAND